jgi:hypothetical protein
MNKHIDHYDRCSIAFKQSNYVIPKEKLHPNYLLTNVYAAYSGVSLVGAYTAATVAAPIPSLPLT